MRDGPAVSVLIATYRSPESLRRVVDGVLAQLAPDDEVVVVDDGSGDSTPSVLAAVDDQRLTTIVQTNQGVSAARNRAAVTATNPLLVFLDDDELPTPGWLDAHRLAHVDPGKVVMGRAELVVPAGRRMQVIPPPPLGEAGEPPTVLVNDSFSVARDAFRSVGGFDERFVHGGEDVDLGLRLTAAGLELAIAPTAVIRHEINRTYREFRRQRLRRGQASLLLEAQHGVALVPTGPALQPRDRRWAAIARPALAAEIVSLALWAVVRLAGLAGRWRVQAAAAGRATLLLGVVGRTRAARKAHN